MNQVDAGKKKRFKGYFDVLAEGLNPWTLVPTHAVFDSSDLDGFRDAYQKYGICVVRRFFDRQEQQDLYELHQDFTGLTDSDIHRVFSGEIKPGINKSPTTKDKRYWPFVTNKNARNVAKAVFLDKPVTEIATSAAAHYSAKGLHRDLGGWYSKPTCDISLETGEKSGMRMLMYPARPGTTAGTFAVIPYSHRRDLYDRYAKEVGVKRPFDWYDQHRQLINKMLDGESSEDLDEMESYLVWVSLDPGDIVVMDARMQHSGDFVRGPRYLLTTTFVEEDDFVLKILSNRWKTEISATEANYYRMLHKNGLASSRLISLMEEAL